MRGVHHLTRPCGQTSFSTSGFRSILGAGPVTSELVSAFLTLSDEAMSAFQGFGLGLGLGLSLGLGSGSVSVSVSCWSWGWGWVSVRVTFCTAKASSTFTADVSAAALRTLVLRNRDGGVA